MSSEELGQVRGPAWWRRLRAAISPRLRHVQLVDARPGDLRQLGQSWGLPEALLEQLQSQRLPPGLQCSSDWVLARLDVPCLDDDGPLQWRRVDVLLGAAVVVTAAPGALEVLTCARRRLRRHKGETRGDTLLCLVVSEVVAALEDAVTTLGFRLEAQVGSSALPQPLPQADALEGPRLSLLELRRGLSLLREALGDFQHPRRHRLVGPVPRAGLVACRERLGRVDAEAERLLWGVGTVAEQIYVAEEAAANEASELAAARSSTLEGPTRQALSHTITALLGGVAVGFGLVAMAWTAGPWLEAVGPVRARMLGALAFPIGLMILLLGSGALGGVDLLVSFSRTRRRKAVAAVALCGLALFINLLGALAFLFLASRAQLFGAEATGFLVDLAVEKTSLPFWPSLLRGVFAGWLMMALGWLLLSTRGPTARLLMLWAVGFLLVAGHFDHVVISTAEIFLGSLLGAQVTAGSALWGSFVPVLLGNLVGALVFAGAASLLRPTQARALRPAPVGVLPPPPRSQ
jgi:formate/nitrite transporter FocA (FNT family)